MSSSSDMGGPLAAQAAEMGFAGLDFGFGAFPIVSLNQGRFVTSDGKELGEGFNCIFHGSRPKYLIKTAVPDTDERQEVTYTYDGRTDMNGKPLQEKIDKWARMGMSYEQKNYIEVAGKLEDGTMVLLSIPSTSVRRFSSCIGTMIGRGLPVENTWVWVHKGPLVTKAVKDFTPWAFHIQA